jgi:hypothetical protein
MAMQVIALVLAASMIAPPPVESEVIGGYYEGSEVREREPDDGDHKVLIGSIMAPLGILRAAGAAAMLVTAQPDRCQKSYGSSATESTCSGLRIYSYLGLGIGGAMIATGAVFLALGLGQRRRHKEWKRRYGIAAAPAFHRHGVGIGVSLRF